MNEHYQRTRFVPIRCTSGNQKADFNTKPHGGITLPQKCLPLMGYHHYPPPNSEHFKLLKLAEHNIGIHRGSFRIDRPCPKSILKS